MGYPILKSSTAQPLVFLLILSSDHISPATGKTPTVTISKNGGSFASPAGAVTEIANGWYKVAGNVTDSGTLGPLILHVTEASSDPVDDVFPVVNYDPQDAVHLGLTALPNTAVSANASLLTSGTGTDQLSVSGGRGKSDVSYWNAHAVVAENVNGVPKVDVVDWLGTAPAAPNTAGVPIVDTKYLTGTAQTARDIGASVLLSAGTGTGQLDFTSGVLKGNLAQILGTALTETSAGYLAAGLKKFLDVATPVFTAASVNQTGDNYARLGAPAGASVSADLAAVKAETAEIDAVCDQFTFTVSGMVDSNVLDWKSATAPAMTGDAYARLGAPVGASISADIAGVPAALLDLSNGVETSLTLRQALRLMVAADAGKLSGAATSTVKIRNIADSKDRITATVDSNGNRSAITTDLS